MVVEVVEILLVFLLASMTLYGILGGADFGVGVLETTTRRETRRIIRQVGTKVIAPVWEANHIWMIIGLVILFVGFPGVHFRLMTALHLPMVGMLLGILLRGTAFTFRYYTTDAEHTRRHQLWTLFFRLGSIITGFFFGVMTAAVSRGLIEETPSHFYTSFVGPWVGILPFANGLFTLALFAWIASIFLIGEASGSQRVMLVRLFKRITIFLVLFGAVVTLSAWREQNAILINPAANHWQLYIGANGVFTLSASYLLMDSNRIWLTRIAGGATVFLIIAGYWSALYPRAIILHHATLNWTDGAAPEATLIPLVIALSLGSLSILPASVWLYRVFGQK